MKISSFLPILFVLFLYAGNLYAQDPTTADANVTVSANVFTELTVTVNNNVDFGNIGTNDGPYYLSTGVTGDSGNDGIVSGETIGQITFSGEDGEGVTISVTQQAILSDGSNTLNLDETIGDQGADAVLTTPGTITLGTNTNNTGDYILLIGGSLDDATVSGTYTTGNTGGQVLIINGDYTSI
ncbi:MAG: hypothetical protein WD035_01665 [Balneolaceae bacterium]